MDTEVIRIYIFVLFVLLVITVKVEVLWLELNQMMRTGKSWNGTFPFSAFFVMLTGLKKK